MHYCNKKSWYVIRVRSQSENRVHFRLNKKLIEVLNPTYQTLSARKDRRKFLIRPIFKGYIFVNALLNAEKHLEILKTPGVVEILKNTNGPSPIPEEQMENVRLLENHIGNFVFRSKFEIGNKIVVREGPLKGLRGAIDRLDKKKIHIHVDSIPGSVMIEIDPNQIQLENDSIYSIVAS